MQRIWKILKAIEPINRTEEAVFILYIEKVRSKKMGNSSQRAGEQ